MEHIDIKAEVFRVLRANSDKTPNQINEILTEHLPRLSMETLVKVIKELEGQ